MRLVAISLVLSLIMLPSCSDGSFDDQHDRYENLFGFSLVGQVAGKAALIGRAVLANGQPARWAEANLYRVDESKLAIPLGTMTNDKGGFYLGGLEPGAYRLFILSPVGEGSRLDVRLEAGRVTESHARLGELHRISGKVTLKGEPRLMGTMVFVANSPFRQLTDQDGAFYFDVPEGTYEVRATRETFAEGRTEELHVTADTAVELELAADPWPNGKVKIVSDDPFIVRGLTTKLLVEAKSGVRFMRVRNIGYGSPMSDAFRFGSWEPLAPELTLRHASEGFNELQFDFIDAYGKQSDPVTVRYFNTTLDRSWRILHSQYEKPVVIRSGEKVAFLTAAQYLTASGSVKSNAEEVTLPNGPDPSPASEGSGPTTVTQSDEGTRVDPSRPASSSNGYYPMTVFTGPVTIEAGAKLLGGAYFAGKLTIKGEADRPVTWDLTEQKGFDGRVVFSGVSFSAEHLHVQGGSIEMTSQAPGEQRAELVAARFNGVILRQSTNWYSSDEPFASHWRIAASTLAQVSIEQSCGHYAAGNEQSAEAEASPGKSASTMTLALEQNDLSRSALILDCIKRGGWVTPRLVASENNFFSPPPAGYFLTSHVASAEAAIPSAEELEYEAADNHFADPGRLHPKVGEHGWPEAILGPNRATPRPR